MEIGELKSMIGRSEDDWVADFETAAEEYYHQHGRASLRPLMNLLGDQLPDDINFAVIHIIEQADSDDYVRALIAQVIERGGKLDYWLDILHFRIFNSAPDLKAYALALQDVDPAGRTVVFHYLEALAQDPRNAKFSPQINLLQKVATENGAPKR